MELLNVKGLCKSYDGFQLKDVSFTLESGYIMGFVGRNGAGKTTTLKSMIGLVKPESGSVSICGMDAAEHELECRQMIAVVFGGFDYYGKTAIRKITDVFRRFYENWDEEAYRRYMKMFSIDENKHPDELSNGMRVKYELALALSHDARLLIFDEPTSGLDPVSRDDLLDVFRSVIEDGERSILFSTHITSDLEKCADFVTYIKNGKIVFSEEHAVLRESYLLAKGGKDAGEKLGGILIGKRENMFGFDALVAAENADTARAAGLELSPADIETIMIHMEKE